MIRIAKLLKDEWDTFKIVMPSIVFTEGKISLPLEGVTLEIEFVGGRHTPDSTIVTVLDDDVMFMGDCFYPPPPYLNLQQLGFDDDMLKGFLDRNLAYYVDGHNGIYRADDWRNTMSE